MAVPSFEALSAPAASSGDRVSRRRLIVVSALCAAFGFETIARYVGEVLQLSVASEVLSFFAILSMVVPALLLIMRLQLEGFLRWTLTLSAAMLVASQGLNLFTELIAPLWPGFFSNPVGALHSQTEATLLILGFLLMLAALYSALIDTSTTKTRLALERAELAEEVRQRREIAQALHARMAHQAAINELGQFALGCGTAQELLERASQTIQDGLRVSQSAVWQVRNGHSLVLAAGHGWQPGTVGHFRLTVDDALPESMLSVPEVREVAELHGLREELSTPFGRRGHSAGILSAFSGTVRNFTGDEWSFLESVSHMVAATLERLHAEEALGKNERYFRAIIDHALDLITVLNADGTIRYESPSIRHVLGYEQQELQGRSVFSVIHPEDISKVMAHFSEGMERPEEVRSTLLRCRHKDGTWRTLEAIGRNLIHDEDIQGAIINSRDVTERVQLEQQLLQAQKMEGIGRLAGGVAHDFNNLLTAIVGYTQLTSAAVPAKSKVSGYVDQIALAASRASSLTRQLLAFARKQILEPRVINVNDLVLNLEEMLKRLIGEDVELLSYPRSSGCVLADPGQFEQVIINLVLNARDAMPRGGTIIIETLDQTLDEEYTRHHTGVKPGRYVMLAISDTGVGMTPEVRARIFEPFFTTKEQGKGTGLGLATCYGIVRQAEGHIWVYSEPNQGATFKLYLPRVDLLAEQICGEELVELRPATETVLLVEDDPLVREISAEILREQGYVVLQAESPVQAVSIAMEHSGEIHLLLTDVVMPVMGGRQLSDLLREHRPVMRVLYMSGYTDDAILQHGVLDEGVEFISKPFTPVGLSKRLRSILDA